MGYVLCTAEKPSVAGEIANVIGATKKCNGYYEGNGYRVTWAVGHLVGLAEPEEYGYMSLKDLWDKDNPQNKQEALAQLPMVPEQFKLVVLPGTKDQFKIVAGLMNDPECEYIIDCGDAGAEGHILQWFIRVKAGCKKPVKRFMATSATDEAIRDAMSNLQPAEKYIPVIRGEFCKKKADWIMGMSMSRGASITYNARVDVGRVQSPTLFFVVKRYMDVSGFKSKDFYSFKADLKDGFSVFFNKDNQSFFPVDSKDSDNRLVDKLLAEKTASEIRQLGKGKVVLCETKNKATDRPQLYDITELERDGNRIFGYTAEEVLKTAQSLYETHKITTYPRTDSRYITHDLEPLMIERIKDISTHAQYEEYCKKLIEEGLNIDKKIMDDSKVTDHHAILVTNKIRNYDLSKLTEIEKNILNLVITRMLVSFSDKFKYKETVINVAFENGMVFGASGKVPVSKGWKDVQDKLAGKYADEEPQGADEEQLFPDISLGQIVELNKINVQAKKTTPPKLHTEASLLTAMENAGASIEGGAILKGKGIGTQATRANIIKQLFDKGYVTNLQKGKIKYLVPTKQGMSVIKVLPPELYSPKITADWENQIAEIVSGTMTEEDFMRNFNIFIQKNLAQILNHKVENVDFSYERASVGTCPWCGSAVYEGELKDRDNKPFKNVYCSNKECKMSIRYDDLAFDLRTGGKKISQAQMKKLLEKGQIEVNCLSKSKTPYKGICKLVKSENGWAKLVFDLAPAPGKKPGSKKNPFAT